MAKLQRLATREDGIVVVHNPVNEEELKDRKEQYLLLSDKQFATRYNHMLYLPVEFTWNDKSHKIQYNFCTNPFCKWCGQEQVKFETVKGKPSRYKISGTSSKKSLVCNPDPIHPNRGMTLNCYSTAVSNWSVAEEISRLIRINQTQDVEPKYSFHKDTCVVGHFTPFDNPYRFYKQGKTLNNAQRWQCKVCKKKTSVLPNKRQSTTYRQKRNDILPMFAKLLLNKMPINRTCDILEIGVSTYYHKLEWLYRCCLEFLDKYETPHLNNQSFEEMWLNTDKMHYNLNNVRKKGQGGKKYAGLEDNQVQTYVVVSADAISRYVFRVDVAYDWEMTVEDLKYDTVIYKEDHLNDFSKKNNRLDFSYYPQEPSPKDNQKLHQFREELNEFNKRMQYVDGLHVNPTYTTMAHFWLIKKMVNANEWRMISDNDPSIKSAFFRVFSKEVRLSDAHHFICSVDKNKSRKQCLEEFEDAKLDLLDWGFHKGYETKNLRKLAYFMLKEHFENHKFHKEISTPKQTYKDWAENPIIHPLASRDKGFHKVDCRTDLSSYEPKEIAKMVMNVNDNATNSFIQQIRRRLSILERPLMTARGDGKSYIYANFNPKYAQYALTILRTFYNFCETYKSADGKELTPAQRLGITDKVFDLRDIIYLR
ncbi:insertion element protein [Gracilibacillus oryzae]|uniref:Insertion element protein n=2 Tax=Gracilibacillus TaxID=74385 RepID=A0A7C8L3N5_9BACI|nr:MULTISPECIES: insertion element protein [Gracilibacillus]KAB8136249.1 insertion element protein [Gracilibacillus oryzae]UOQ83670.1 insertion element protein [Gracilibacillus salinarum]